MLYGTFSCNSIHVSEIASQFREVFMQILVSGRYLFLADACFWQILVSAIYDASASIHQIIKQEQECKDISFYSCSFYLLCK